MCTPVNANWLAAVIGCGLQSRMTNVMCTFLPRYLILHKYGGVYLDCDVSCYRCALSDSFLQTAASFLLLSCLFGLEVCVNLTELATQTHCYHAVCRHQFPSAHACVFSALPEVPSSAGQPTTCWKATTLFCRCTGPTHLVVGLGGLMHSVVCVWGGDLSPRFCSVLLAGRGRQS